jgi:hypothetical protein
VDCINLKKRFGRRYRVTYEESYHAEYGPNARVEDPWLMIIPCQYGEICPWGDDNLAACTKTAGRIAKRLKALPYCRVVQDGDDGANTVFPVDHFDEVASIMLPRRRRRLSPEARQRLAEAGAKTQFSSGTQKRHEGQRGPFDTEGDPKPVQRQLALFDA